LNCRSISARESTAAAERWRYIQTVLERRRKESLVSRERFIRQPLDNILRQKAGAKQVGPAPVVWDSFVAGRSILKRRALNWRAKAGRHVHFDSNQQANEANDKSQNGDKLPQLPVVSIPEETEAPGSNESSFTNEEDQRLPLLLMTPSPRLEIITDAQQQHNPGDDDDDTTLQRVSPSGPSWVERQVAKVKQRKLWAFRQQQQQQQQKLNHHPPRTILKRSVSMLVNVPDEPDTDSLNEEEEEEEEESDRSDSGQPVVDDGIHRNSNNRQSLAWEVSLDKDEFVEMSSDQIKDAEATADDPYGGWPHFPVKLAICIQQRQKSLKERSKAGRKGKKEEATTTTTGSEGKFHPNNSFERRKRFGKRLSIAVVRQRKRRIPKRGPLSSIHQPRASCQSGESRQPTPNADDIKGHDPAAVPANLIVDDVVGQCLTNAIPLQVLDEADLRSSVSADAIPDISGTHKSNEIDSPVASSSPISDKISEADVMTPQAALLDDSSVGPESEAETIAADAQSHLDEMIPAADDSMADEDDDHTAGSAFSPPTTSRAGQRQREEITDADETISNVTVDDGPYLIDQPAESTNVLKAIPPQQDVGMASRADNIPAAAGISPVEQTEFRIASRPLGSSSISAIDNKDSGSPAGTRLAAYCSGWPMAISNQNGGDAIPYSPMATVSDWNNFEAPTSEETMASTINRPEVDVSSDATALALTIPAAQKDSNHAPVVADSSTAGIIQTSLDKKTKEARNASRILFPPAVTSTPTQTEPPPPPGSKEDHEENKCRSSTDVKESDEETGTECQCLHRAVLTCLLPEAAETLANLELIRRQLKKARIRRQGMSDQLGGRQPLQVRRDIFSTFDPDSSTTN
jgi:hypothetical protein